jgi:hypothetical protein
MFKQVLFLNMCRTGSYYLSMNFLLFYLQITNYNINLLINHF